MANKTYKVCIPFIVTLVLVLCVADVEAKHNDSNDDEEDDQTREWLSPWDVNDLPPEPRENFYRDLRSCLRTLTRRCNRSLYNYVISKQKIQKPCCKKLYKMEKGCLESLAWMLGQTKYESRVGHIDERFADALNKCVLGFD